MSGGVLIGRESERAWLEAALSESLARGGSHALLAGEAGVGKTCFAEEVLGSADAHFLRGASSPAALAYGPVIAALREFLRAVPGGLSDCGPLRSAPIARTRSRVRIRSGGCATTCAGTARCAS